MVEQGVRMHTMECWCAAMQLVADTEILGQSWKKTATPQGRRQVNKAWSDARSPNEKVQMKQSEWAGQQDQRRETGEVGEQKNRSRASSAIEVAVEGSQEPANVCSWALSAAVFS